MEYFIEKENELKYEDHKYIAQEEPSNVYYQATQATGSSGSGFSFYLQSPTSNALLSPDAVIEYQIQIDSSNVLKLSTVFESLNSAGGNLAANPSYLDFLNSVNNYRICLRQCWPISRAIQKIDIRINQTQYSCNPQYWIDAFNRLYISEEESATICTLSGGEFDSGPYVPVLDTDNTLVGTTNTGAINNNSLISFTYRGYHSSAVLDDPSVITGYSSFPENELYYNKGFSKRFHRMALLNRSGGSLTGSSNNVGPSGGNQQTNLVDTGAHANQRFVNGGVNFKITVYERIPISPFFMYESRDEMKSIPNVRNLNLNVQMNANYSKLILQGGSGETDAATGIYSLIDLNQNAVVDFYSTQPILHLKWFISNEPIKEIVKIPFRYIMNYINPVTLTAANFPVTQACSNALTFEYKNITLQAIPDLLLIYLKADPGSETYVDPTDHNMEINDLNLTVANVSGKVLNMSSGEMYKTWLQSVKHKGTNKSDYQTWRKRHCVVALQPKDYGTLFGPGFNYPVMLNLKGTAYSWWNIPSIQNSASIPIDAGNNVTYLICVIAVYDRYILELNASGGSRLDLLKIPIK